MKKIFLMAVIASVVLLQVACRITGVNVKTGNTIRGNGKVTEEVRTLSGIRQVTLATLGELQIKTGDEESLLIRADENILPEIRSEVDGLGMLTIDINPEVGINPVSEIAYVLTVKELDGIHLTSLGSAEAGPLQADEFEMSVLGSGSLKIDSLQVKGPVALTLSSLGSVDIDQFDAKKLTAEISSSGQAVLSGKVEEADIQLSSMGSFEGRNLDIDSQEPARVNLSTSGSGSIHTGDIHASQGVFVETTSLGSVEMGVLDASQLVAKMTGSGNVKVDGGAVNALRAELSSLGSLHAEDLTCQNADINISGSGSAYVWAENLLKAHLSSLGSLFYGGQPKMEIEVSGTGEVKPAR